MNEMNLNNFANGSVVSYPERDNRFGDNSWRGNCSGYLIKDLVKFFKPKFFVDACEGSGTSRDICKYLGIDYVGLDLFNGQDFTKDSILKSLNGKESDLCFSHPPYHDMIPYSNSQWGKGNGIVDGDTSHCSSVDEFLEKSQVMLMNQREATKEGGIYATLIGDQKKKGVCSSFQADFLKMMPNSELLNVVIKMQHNTKSANRTYNGNFIPISHEYLLLWKKKAQSIFSIGLEIASLNNKRVAMTWRSVLRVVMMNSKGAVTLDYIYNQVEKVAGSLIANNENWKAKIRQQLQKYHTSVSRGVWAL